MFILFGSRRRLKITDPEGVVAPCPNCGKEARFIEKKVRNWFTLYFLPIFPMDKGLRFVECSHCHEQYAMTLDDVREKLKEREVEWSRVAEQQKEREEKLRARIEVSGDPQSYLELLGILAEQERFDDIVALGDRLRTQFPTNADLLMPLAFAYRKTGRYDEAIKLYREIVGLNPYLAPARYHLAWSLYYSTPPQREAAAEQMKIAADMGYADSREALQKIRGGF
ncbi:MAG: hypothetical protein C4321_02945 [Chloroflexota bacterium]